VGSTRRTIAPGSPRPSPCNTGHSDGQIFMEAEIVTKNGADYAVGPTKAQVYEWARTAHLERSANGEPTWLIYRKPCYDFDEELAGALPYAMQLTWRRTLWFAFRAKIDTIELNEPLVVTSWPQIISLALLLRVRSALGRGSVGIVAYCIENLDPVGKTCSKTNNRVPRPLIKVAVGAGLALVCSLYRRLAFGTEAALDNYLHAAVPFKKPILRKSKVFTALPAPVKTDVERDPETIAFLGVFDTRKGVLRLLEAWPEILARRPAAKLLVMGKGPLLDQVAAWCATRPEVRLIVDPTREQIQLGLGSATCLVLLSQRTPTWREQVGLPIVEGLALGCEIVATTETGLADELRRTGHRVIPPDARPADVAAAVAQRLETARDRSILWKELPREDGREQAGRWMMAG